MLFLTAAGCDGICCLFLECLTFIMYTHVFRIFARPPVRLASTARRALTAFFVVLSSGASAAPEDRTPLTVSDHTPVAALQEDASAQAWSLHGQLTNVTQHHPRLTSPYSGPNSLTSYGRTEETTDVTLYAGLRLWQGAELWINPELDQGFGLSNTVGLAGFSSGEAYKIGANTPYWRMPRAFIRQVISLPGAVVPLENSANQFGGARAVNNVTLTVGKFSVTDIFDQNTYAHDPRADFLNWSVIDAGAFDYAADAWGFTYGAAAEWNHDAWTLRGGMFQLSKVPNGKISSVDFGQFTLVSEFEQRYQWQGRAGKVKLLGFVNYGKMASYDDAVRLAHQTSAVPDNAAVRRTGINPGMTLNFEQELAPDLGVFLRTSINGGKKEAYEFTEINRSISGGVALKGQCWGRADDTFGMAGTVNGLSGQARAYFAAGGTGILIGDGQLRYAAEKIIESYYSVRINRFATLALNYQHVNNPAYNHDRGPVHIYGTRLHLEF